MKKVEQISLLLFKGLSAFCFAFVLTLIGQELVSFGLFSFIFLLSSISLSFLYFVKDYKFFGTLAVDIILILLAFLLRLYVILAYGS